MLVAPSTSQDPTQRLLRAALSGLAALPVRVLAALNRHPGAPPSPSALHVPGNARLVDWVSYSQTMPLADLVVCHAGHGTLAPALACGAPVVTVPGCGRHGRERRARPMGGSRAEPPGRFLSQRRFAGPCKARSRPALGARHGSSRLGEPERRRNEAAAALVERFAASRASRS